MRRAASLVIKCIKDREGRVVETYCNSCDSSGLRRDEIPCSGKATCDILLAAGLGGWFDVDRNVCHERFPSRNLNLSER
jgi:hypothetical protein